MSEGYEAIFSAVSENIPLASTLSGTLLMGCRQNLGHGPWASPWATLWATLWATQWATHFFNRKIIIIINKQ